MSLATPQVEVMCNGPDCEVSEFVALRWRGGQVGGGYSEENVTDEMRHQGWLVDGATHICPDCQEKEGSNEVHD